jgi:hypothetical protein
MNTKEETRSIALVEGPTYSDAKFYGEWLLAAASAQALWDHFIEDGRFKSWRDTLTELPPLDEGATYFLYALWAENQISFSVSVKDELEAGQFLLMTEMGFFILAGGRYQMAIPSNLDICRVRRAAMRYLETKDKDGFHPDRLITTMSWEQLKEWEELLDNLGEEQRCADRAILLESPRKN